MTVILVAAATVFPFAAALTLLTLLNSNALSSTRATLLEVFAGLLFSLFVAGQAGIFVNGLWHSIQPIT